MNTTAPIVPLEQARKHLGELIQQAHYKSRPFILTRNKKPMAALIGTDVFESYLEWLEQHNPGLADTLAIMCNPDVQKAIDAGDRDVAEGRTVPIETLLDD